jgi:hypothetical protein
MCEPSLTLARIDIADAACTKSKTEFLPSNLAKFLKLREEPLVTSRLMDRSIEMQALPNIDMEDPSLPKVLTESADPSCTKSNALIALPTRINPRAEREEPTSCWERMLHLFGTFTVPKTLMFDPRRTNFLTD